jgi:hypothetical protein
MSAPLAPDNDNQDGAAVYNGLPMPRVAMAGVVSARPTVATVVYRGAGAAATHPVRAAVVRSASATALTSATTVSPPVSPYRCIPPVLPSPSASASTPSSAAPSPSTRVRQRQRSELFPEPLLDHLLDRVGVTGASTPAAVGRAISEWANPAADAWKESVLGAAAQAEMYLRVVERLRRMQQDHDDAAPTADETARVEAARFAIICADADTRHATANVQTLRLALDAATREHVASVTTSNLAAAESADAMRASNLSVSAKKARLVDRIAEATRIEQSMQPPPSPPLAGSAAADAADADADAHFIGFLD